VSYPPRRTYAIPLPDRRSLALGERCLVMGILNVTPDSFAERAHRIEAGAAAGAALEMEREGADLIDVGGQSTRPGSQPVSAGEELGRVLPVLQALRGRIRVPLSIDTSKSEVARAALAEGAAIVNDVSGLRVDPALARVAADAGAPLVLMHSRGTPETMIDEAAYGDVVREAATELRGAIAVATTGGVPIEQIIVDPGIGFAKRAAHSYGVLARLAEFAAALDRPVLVGASRKSFLRAASGGRPAAERDWATAAAVTAAVLGGAHIVRVHAVAEMAQVVRTAEEIRNATGHRG
jgi:dihydropteroate synthase